MSPPRVVVVLPPREVFSPGGTGAVGLVVHRLASAPSAFEAVVAGPPTAAPFADARFIPVRPSRFWLGQTRRFAAGVARLIATAPPALIEVHNRPDVALALARRFPARPVMLFLHNDPRGMRGARTPAERAALLRRLARVVTVSDFLRRQFSEGLRGAEVAVLPNCVDLRGLPPAGTREPLVLFAGRVVSDKGADVFVEACARALPRLSGWRAELLGADRFGAASPETPYLATLRPKAAAAGVAMPGWRPHGEVIAAMARAAIVVVPSRWAEPFGLAALEAMACGAAVLASRRGGLPEVVGEVAVPIDPEAPEQIAEAIVALAADPARRVILGEAGRRRAAAFDVGRAIAALDALRRQTLAAWPHGVARPI
jgi:UDP-glucose:(glucosyl)LPS alpha-1,2-glucosyltransferase